MDNKMLSVSNFRYSCGCEKLKALYSLNLNKGMALLRTEANALFCKTFASGADFTVIEKAIRDLYLQNADAGKTECPLEWQFETETKFDIKLYERLYVYLTEDYMPSARARVIDSNIDVTSPENGLHQRCSLLFEREDGAAEAFILEYENKIGISAKATSEKNKVENDLRLLVLLHGLSEKYPRINVNMLFLKTGMDAAATDLETGEPYVSEIFSYKAVRRTGTKDDNRMTIFLEDTSYITVNDGEIFIDREAVSAQIAHMKDVVIEEQRKKGNNCARCSERDICRAQSFSGEYWKGVTRQKEGKPFSGELSPEQKAVVDDCYGKVAVIAPPGSGKTHTLIGIAEKMLNDGIRPDDILILAFSNAAKNEIELRLSANHEKLPDISTIHSYAWTEILGRYQGRAYGFEPIAAAPRQQSQLMFACLNECGTYIKGLSYRKGMIVDAEGVGDSLSRCFDVYKAYSYAGVEGIHMWLAKHKDVELDVDAFVKLFERYEELLRQGHFVIYDGMVVDAAKLLAENADIASQVRRRHAYVIVDEYQDVNDAEGELVDLLADKNLVVVGDDDQSIYHFKGCSPTWLVEFTKRHKNAKLHVLSDNYRSTEEIISVADQFMKLSEEDRIKKNIVTHKKGAGPVINYVKTKADAPMAVSELVGKLHDSGVPLRNIAVIARKNEELESIRTQLQYPCHLNRALVVKDPMFLTLAFLVKASVIGIGECNRELFKALNAADPILTSIIPVDKGDVYHSVLKFLELPDLSDADYWNNITQEEDDRLSNWAGNDYRYVLDLFEMCTKLNELAKHNPMTKSYLSAFRVLTDREEHVLFPFLEDRMEKNGSLDNIRGLWNEIRDMLNFSDDARFDIATTESVTLTTAHDSKGREWESVIVYDVDKFLSLSSSFDPKKNETIEDGRRLLYVAMTRAKTSLDLIAVEDRGKKSQDADYKFSRELSAIMTPAQAEANN